MTFVPVIVTRATETGQTRCYSTLRQLLESDPETDACVPRLRLRERLQFPVRINVAAVTQRGEPVERVKSDCKALGEGTEFTLSFDELSGSFLADSNSLLPTLHESYLNDTEANSTLMRLFSQQATLVQRRVLNCLCKLNSAAFAKMHRWECVHVDLYRHQDSGVQLFHVHSKHDLGQYCRAKHEAVCRAQDTVRGVMFETGPVDDLRICCDAIPHSVVPLDSVVPSMPGIFVTGTCMGVHVEDDGYVRYVETLPLDGNPLNPKKWSCMACSNSQMLVLGKRERQQAGFNARVVGEVTFSPVAGREHAVRGSVHFDDDVIAPMQQVVDFGPANSVLQALRELALTEASPCDTCALPGYDMLRLSMHPLEFIDLVRDTLGMPPLPVRRSSGRTRGDRTRGDRTRGDRTHGDRTHGDRTHGDRTRGRGRDRRGLRRDRFRPSRADAANWRNLK